MAVDKKVETLEGEIKLMKGELKETLTSVRDFLLNLKMPPPRIEGLEGGESGKVDIGGVLAVAAGSAAQAAVQSERAAETPLERPALQPVEPEQPRAAPASEAAPPRQSPQIPKAEASPPPEIKETASPENEAPAPVQHVETEAPSRPAASVPMPDRNRDAERSKQTDGQESPQVNLLASLLRWVSVATREIGSTQLPTFLDVYGTAGNLTPEMRDVILNFAGIVEQQPLDDSGDGVWGHLIIEQLATFLDVSSVNGSLSSDLKDRILRFASSVAKQSSRRNIADVWSWLLLELHGILTGGGISLRPLKPVLDSDEDNAGDSDNELKEDTGEVIAPLKDNSVTLKLVFPASAGKEKEDNVDNLSINVNPYTSTKKSQARTTKVKKVARKKS